MTLIEIFWTVVFFSSMAVFFGIAAIVTVKGLDDVKELFHHLSKDGNE